MTTEEKAEAIVGKFAIEIESSDFHIPEFITGVKMADSSKEYEKILKDETEALAIILAIIHVKGIIGVLNKFMVIEEEGAPTVDMLNTNQGRFYQSILTELERK